MCVCVEGEGSDSEILRDRERMMSVDVSRINLTLVVLPVVAVVIPASMFTHGGGRVDGCGF